jgi:plastocyanin
MRKFIVLAGAAITLWACGSSSNNNGNTGPTNTNPTNPTKPSGPTISIGNYTFSPAELTVDAGTTIAIVNNDGFAHTVISETADNAFTEGAVNGVSFNSGTIPAATTTGGGPYGGGNTTSPGNGSISIPANAQSGTVIPFFCTIHKGMMSPANGHITIR